MANKRKRCHALNASRNEKEQKGQAERIAFVLRFGKFCGLDRLFLLSEFAMTKARCRLVDTSVSRWYKGQIKDRHFFVDQRLFWGMIWPVATIDASAVREMNL